MPAAPPPPPPSIAKRREEAPPSFSARGRTFEVLIGFARFVVLLLVEQAIRRIPIVAWLAGGKKKERGPERLRYLLERFGGAFIKFGQLFSMRSDILPPSYCAELSNLYDDVPPFPAEDARAIVERELGKPIDQLFTEFDDVPVGAASFGQVHRVKLKGGEDDGRVAVVKVCRPGSEATIEIDARLLILLGHVADAISLLGRIRLVPVFRDFVRWTRREVNYLQEGKNADHLHELTHWNPRQRIPYVYWQLTTKKVLTMEYLEGFPVSEIIRRFEAEDETLDEELAAFGCDRTNIARNVWQSFLLSAFVGQAFHGDPHPGNLIALPDNTVGFIDFGLQGKLNEEARREQGLLLDAVGRENIERIFVSVLDLLDAPRGLLVTDTYEDFAEQCDGWLDACDNPGAPLAEKTLNRLVGVTMQIAREIGLVMAPNTILFYKALLSVDSVVLRVCPEFDYKKESRRALRLVRMRELDKLYGPGALIDTALMAQLILSNLPEFAALRLQDFEQGQRLIFRKLNLLPVIAAGIVRAGAWGLLALLAGIGARKAGIAPSIFAREEIAPAVKLLDLAATVWVFIAGAVIVAFWFARALSARAYVKVQKD
jgi:predicted unusual protein kinase regulating ubiquinone biosynthesis (AarF/ABC1/UbiB family)